jgi:uncharacterized membrane protein YdfJ with MMPL/SSD domain
VITRLSELVAQRTRPVLITAGIVFILAAVIGIPVVSILKSESSEFQDPSSQNQQAIRLIERASGQSANFGVAALVPSRADARTHPAQARGALRVGALLAAQPGFQRELTYPATRLPALVSRNGRQTLVLAAFATQARSAEAVEDVRPILVGRGVRFGGNDVAFNEINKRTTSDLKLAETIAFPLLLLLSFWVFRGLVAAMLPLLVGGFAIVITFLLLRLVDQVLGVSIFAVNLVTGLGLGLGIDYSLFVVSRYREELLHNSDNRAAIARTLQTAGRTVLYSSLTVAGALACLLVFPQRFLYSMGIGGGLVALCAGAVALTVLPAVLIALGPRINALAPARLQRSRARASEVRERGLWARLARVVMHRPGQIAFVTGAALLLVASPALHLQLIPPDAHVLPSSSQPRQVAEAVTRNFAVDGSEAITMVVQAPARGSLIVSRLARSAARTAGTRASVGPRHYLGRRVWEIELLPHGTVGAPANEGLVKRLRALANPPTLFIGGATAAFIDQKAAVSAHAPVALLILALITGGFLFVMTGSLVLPLMALVMNLLTVAVGAGLLVLIFQDGNLSPLLGFSPIGGLEEANLVLLFVVAFALSTDYGVFLFARIKEAHDTGLPTREAVAHGLERTGRLITAAALLLCVALGTFVISHIFFIKQLGIGVALTVAIDATVVRALLVPALMGRLGERTWWAPRPLRRLYGWLGQHGQPDADTTP